MLIYKVEFVKSAQKELKKLDNLQQTRILKAILKLAQDPRKGNVRPMVASTSWRLRVGNYRVIYDIIDKKVAILIIRIRHRQSVYKK